MWTLRNGAALLLLCAFGGALSGAQQSKVPPAAATVKSTQPQIPLLNAEDGLAVLAAALDFRNRASDKADCSHLVHDIYERAGFSYTYVPSTDLYSSTDEFRRVTRPQPGDLIVWPGHVGIVVSPARHTFYSSLNSGLGVESYDSDYWKQRGRPHFLRYVKEASGATATSANGALKTTSLETKTSLSPADTNEGETAPAPLAAPKPLQLPRLLVVDSARPTTEEVSETLMNALSRTADALRGQNVLGLPQTVSVLSRIQVERIKIKGAAGWADITTAESASLSDGQSSLKKRQQKQRWTLRRRDGQSWDLVVPQGAVYLNQDDAVRLLAQQLAAMTSEESSNDDARQKAQLATLLGSLLQARSR